MRDRNVAVFRPGQTPAVPPLMHPHTRPAAAPRCRLCPACCPSPSALPAACWPLAADFHDAALRDYPESLARNPKAFTQLMDIHRTMPMDRDKDFDPRKMVKQHKVMQRSVRQPDALPRWRDFFGWTE